MKEDINDWDKGMLSKELGRKKTTSDFSNT